MNFREVIYARKFGRCADFFDTLFARAIAGSELPDGYKKVKSLTMDNNCYYSITDFFLKGSDTLKLSASLTATSNLIGSYAGTSSGPNYSIYASTSNVSYLRYGSTNYNSQFDAGVRYNITMTPTGVHGMKRDSTWEELEFTTIRPFCIGTTAANITTSAKFKGTIYGNVIVKDANGLRFKGIPCIRESDDVVGYYDVVSGTFYEPIGENPITA